MPNLLELRLHQFALDFARQVAGMIRELTIEELLAAARWARGHDPSPGFREMSRQALLAFGVEEDDDAR